MGRGVDSLLDTPLKGGTVLSLPYNRPAAGQYVQVLPGKFSVWVSPVRPK
jgi:hypothetical protein